MFLFVKRTFASKVSGTSRIDQSNGGGGGRWKRMDPGKHPGAAGPVGFSEGWAVCGHLRDAHQRPFRSSPLGPRSDSVL